MSSGGISVRGAVEVAAAASLWGTWSLFLRPTELPGIVTAPLALLGVGIGGALWLIFDSAKPAWDRRTVRILIAHAAATAFNVAAFFAALSITTVAIAVLTHCTAPLLVALLAPRIDGARVKGSALAAAVGVVGLVLLLRPWETAADEGVLLGAGLGLASAVAYTATVFLVQPLVERLGIARATSIPAFLAALLIAPFAWPQAGAIELRDLAFIAIGAAFPGTLAAALFLDGLRRVGSARAGVIALLEPTVGVLVGWLVWGERQTLFGLAGAVLLMAAAAWVARARA